MLRSTGKQKVEYELVGSDESDSGSTGSSSRMEAAKRLERRAKGFLYISIGLCLMSLLALTATVYLRKPMSEMDCHKVVSPHSPAFAAWNDDDLWEGDFVNYFNHSTIYRGPPSLEREEAWDNLWSHMAIRLTVEDAAKINRTEPERLIETIDSDPENPTYGGMLEVFHQLHCLNLIRMATWPIDRFDKNWGDLYPEDLTEPVGARMHVDHCIEALRLSLMCYADVTPMVIIRDESRALGSYADFDMHHKCRDFDKLVEWVDRTGTDIPPTNTTNLDDVQASLQHHNRTLHNRSMARKYAKYARPAPQN